MLKIVHLFSIFFLLFSSRKISQNVLFNVFYNIIYYELYQYLALEISVNQSKERGECQCMYRGKYSTVVHGITAPLTHAGSEKEDKLP